MATTFNTIPTKRLAATISGSSAYIKLNNILGWDGADLTPAYLGDVLYAVLRDQDNSVIEIMQLDPTTIANNSTTGITITRRGLKFNGDLTTEVPANKLVWVKNQTIVEIGTDVPQIFQNFVNFTDAQNIGGVKTFTSLPATTAGNPVAANDLARKAYVDAVVAGIATSVSNVVPGTAGETLVAGNLIYLKLADNRWWKTDADDAATVNNVLLGIAQGGGTAGNLITNGVMTRGVDTNQSGMTGGNVMYASNTAGAISSSVGTIEVTVGVAKSATELYFDPRFNQQITENEQDALAGTAGTPSATNKYVTNDDTSGTGLVVRASGLASLYAATFGDGADGDVTIPSGTTTLTKDMYYNNLTIQTGGILNPAGYRIFVKGTLAFQGTGVIAGNGGVGGNGGAGGVGVAGTGGSGGTAGTAGTALAAANLAGGVAGTAGGAGGPGRAGDATPGGAGSAAAPSNLTNAVGSTSGVGQAGGNGGGGFNGVAGGTAGTASAASTVTNPLMMPRTVENAIMLHYYSNTTFAYMNGSAAAPGGSGGGGGAGGNQGAGTAGGGGGGGGGAGGVSGRLVVVAAYAITGGTATCIQALGGAGGNGGNGGNGSASHAGGGGGGSGGTGGTGGVVCFIYNSYSGTALTTACVAGGAGGTAGTGGTNGTNGTAGTAGSTGTTGATGKLYSFAI